MVKDNGMFFWAAVAVVVVLVANPSILSELFSSFGFLGRDDFMVYDDFEVPDPAIAGINTPLWWVPTTSIPTNCTRSGSNDYGEYGSINCKSDKWDVSISRGFSSGSSYPTSSISYTSDGRLALSGQASIKSAKPYNGYDLKIAGTAVTSYSYYDPRSPPIGTLGSSLSLSTPAVKGSFPSGNPSASGTVEIKSGKLTNTSNYQESFVNGEYSSAGTSTLPKFFTISGGGGDGQPSNAFGYISMSTSYVDIVYFKLPFSCVFETNEFLAYEPFAGGRELGLFSFRHVVKKFCLAHPVVINEIGKGTTTSAEPYFRWRQGETLTIPANQNWGTFYVFENDGTIPLTCNPANGEAYNINTSQCTNITGLVTICSEGAFDSATGQCVVYPTIREICEFGRFDKVLNACLYNPPLQAVCQNPDAVYIPETGKCELRVPSEAVCLGEGGTYNPARNVCEWFPIKVITCSDPLAAYDSALDKCVRVLETNYKCSTGVLSQKADGSYICLYEPELQNSCLQGSYDNSLKACVVVPDLRCQGTYNPSTKECFTEVPPQPRCAKGVLFQRTDGTYTCFYEPELQNSCPQGSYDNSLKACVVVPDLQYLCSRGELNENKTACTITPESKIICSEGSFNEATRLCETTIFDKITIPVFGKTPSEIPWTAIIVIGLIIGGGAMLASRRQ